MLADRYYSQILFSGLVVCVWFAALAGAAYDIWAASVLFGFITLLTVIFCVSRIRRPKPVQLPLLIPSLLWLAAVGLSIRYAFDRESAWVEFWGWLFTITYFYLFINVVNTAAERDRFFKWAGAVIIPLTGIAIWQQVTRLPFGYSRIGPFQYGHWEIPSTMINSVAWAGFLLYWTPFYWKKMREKSMYIDLFPLCVVALILARSLWALIALIAAIVWIEKDTIHRLLTAYRRTTRTLLVGVFLLMTGFIYVKWHNRPVGMEKTASYHAGSRFTYWKSAIKMWRYAPIQGVGAGGFATAYPYFKVGTVENTRFAHSFPLQVLAETGAAGFIAMGFWFVLYLRYRGDLKTVFDVTWVILLGYSLMTIQMEYLANKLTFFLVLGAALAGRPLIKTPARTLWLGTIGCAYLLLSSQWLPLSAASRMYTAGLSYENAGDTEKAITLYKEAAELEPFHAESLWRLSQLHAERYIRNRAPEDDAAARAYLQQALYHKKDIRFMHREMTYQKGR